MSDATPQAALQLVGRVKASSGVRLTPRLLLAGRVKATSAANSPISVYLTATAKTLSKSRGTDLQLPIPPLYLVARGSARLSASRTLDLYLARQPLAFVYGNITAQSSMRAQAQRLNLFGSIKTTSGVVAHTTYLQLVGRTGGKSTTRTWSLYRTPNFLNLSGTVTAKSAVKTYTALPPTRVSARSSARIDWAIPYYLVGKIHASSNTRSDFLPEHAHLLDGVIRSITAAKVDAEIAPVHLHFLDGRATARSGSRVDNEAFISTGLFGRISARSSVLTDLAPYNARYLFARSIGGVSSSARADIELPLLFPALSATISARSGAQWRLAFGTFPFSIPASVISARSSGNWIGYLFLEPATLNAASALRSPQVQPIWPFGASTIKSTSWAFAPLDYILFYPPPTLIQPATTESFLELITSEHNQQPNYMATVDFSISTYVEGDLPLVANLPFKFDVDWAVGEQEDFVGQWVGRTRFVNLGNVFFSFDTMGLGFDQANWRGAFDPPESLVRLDDYHYRLLLYATIIANHWNGSIPVAYHAWDTLFAGTGVKVLIQDYGNMTMLYGVISPGTPDRVLQALLTNGHMDLRPEGVQILNYVFQIKPRTPYFAFDSESSVVNGWDVGYWGVLIEPGGAFLPEPEPLLIEGEEDE